MSLKRRIVAGLGPFGLLFGCSPTPAPPAAHRGTTPNTSPLHPLEPADEATTTTAAPTTTTEPPAPVTTVTVSRLPPTTRGTTTTVYVLPEAAGEEDDETWWANQPGHSGAVPPRYISDCESGGNPRAVNPNGHYGKWQFSQSTWESVGGLGRPDQASEAEQDYRASILWNNGRGASHWSCA